MNKFTCLLTGFALATSLPATAILANETPTTRVEFGDLDLRTDSGVETLDGRLRRAISRVCGDLPRGGYVEALAAKRCKAETHADITPQRDAVVRLARNGQAIKVARLDVKAPVKLQ